MGMLTLKTAAKPLASRFEAYVMSHPVARRTVIDLAQASFAELLELQSWLGRAG